MLALTFDDGPSEWTVPILDLLDAAGIPATFFVIGEAVAGQEQVLRRMLKQGCEVGNHTMRHPRLDAVSRRTIRHELRRANRVIERATGVRPAVFRPPGFGFTEAVLEVARATGFDAVVLASATTDDFNRERARDIVDAIVEKVRPGGIVDLHDGRPPNEPPPSAGGTREDRQPTVEAVEILLGTLREYSFVTVSELLAR